ncbi:unnamed protein product [Euphydryas editha]|uniref:Ig-like domain-containing protein n=1 Tax=Euphydryas editha TaxID=104508 RepID=A0AAU9UFE1_EUPED|nr:unnamed protein product [Euphydryas editha]
MTCLNIGCIAKLINTDVLNLFRVDSKEKYFEEIFMSSRNSEIADCGLALVGSFSIWPSPPPSPESSTIRAEQNELTVTFPPLDDIYGSTQEKQFGTENNTVVTSQTGSTALLPCVIRNIGDGIVSWPSYPI